jgi:alkyldihydroxyacetonephosphate synthase
MVLGSLQERLEEKGMLLGHDPWTLPVATVGGAISTNGLGYRGGKYGSMGDQVLGLEAVMPDGEVLACRAAVKSSAGMELKRLFIGTEGCFGVITEATLRIFPRPETHALLGFVFPSFEAGFAAVQEIAALGLEPALLDYGDRGEDSEESVLYLGFEGKTEIVDAEEKLARAACAQRQGAALPRREPERFWRDRHRIAYRFMRNRRRAERRSDGTLNDWVHVALAASRVLSFRSEAMALLSRRRVRVGETGLWTRPELFSMRLSVDGQETARASANLQDAVEEVLSLAQRFGGSMEYCHGIGLKLAPLMDGEHGYGLDAMRRIKRAVDPRGIMNPGKLGL